MKGGGIEYEVKFLDINIVKLKNKLKKLGAKKLHKRILYNRVVFHYPDPNIKGYIRIRNEGGVITMTTKTYKDPKFSDETEIKINDEFNNGVNFLKSINLKQKAYHEQIREKWILPSIKGIHEITIDELPGLPPYCEIDAYDKKSLEKAIKLLNLDETKMRYGAYGKTYNEYYDIPEEEFNDKVESITFKNILNELKPRKNKELLKKISNIQKKYKLK
jgi:adenylate cyclase, class 2